MSEAVEAFLCSRCKHNAHDSTECDHIVGYDHLNGDHECGCTGPMRAPDLATLVGVTYRRIDHWIRCGYLMVEPCGGSGHQREIPDREIEVATIMVRLINAGLTPNAASVVARRMVLEEDTAATLPNDVLIVLLPERNVGGSPSN